MSYNLDPGDESEKLVKLSNTLVFNNFQYLISFCF